jgi:hypothetical protein
MKLVAPGSCPPAKGISTVVAARASQAVTTSDRGSLRGRSDVMTVISAALRSE